ncbi:MAG: ketose-bisphosphate aldolase [Anaerolineaceae bacterium]|nr:MAG: ketose-bisphosphate aldolase [Anaerolineaceae bacterium]
MPLVQMSSLLSKADTENYGVGAFSVGNMEMIMGAIRAAEEVNSPLIIQIAQARLPYSPLHMIGPMMISAAEKARVPVAVHFDHGLDVDVIGQALDLGFTSVMIDASHLPIDQNIEEVGKVKELADRYGASVEAEVGQLGVDESGIETLGNFYSDPYEVKKLYEKTNVDAIALSIGNAHGLYKKEPKLNFQLLNETKKLVSLPLVLHGGSGISQEDFRKAISLGIRKVNIATANFMSVEQEARNYCKDTKRDYFNLSSRMEKGMYLNVLKHIRIFQSMGKA